MCYKNHKTITISASTSSAGLIKTQRQRGKNAVYADRSHIEHARFCMYIYSLNQPDHMRDAIVTVNIEIAALSVRSQYHVLNWLLADRKKEHRLQDNDEMIVEQKSEQPLELQI
jgi:hypothetical protein